MSDLALSAAPTLHRVLRGLGQVISPPEKDRRRVSQTPVCSAGPGLPRWAPLNLGSLLDRMGVNYRRVWEGQRGEVGWGCGQERRREAPAGPSLCEAGREGGVAVGRQEASQLPRASRAEKTAFPLPQLVRGVWGASPCFPSQCLRSHVTLLLASFLLAGPQGHTGSGDTPGPTSSQVTCMPWCPACEPLSRSDPAPCPMYRWGN